MLWSLYRIVVPECREPKKSWEKVKIQQATDVSLKEANIHTSVPCVMSQSAYTQFEG